MLCLCIFSVDLPVVILYFDSKNLVFHILFFVLSLKEKTGFLLVELTKITAEEMKLPL